MASSKLQKLWRGNKRDRGSPFGRSLQWKKYPITLSPPAQILFRTVPRMVVSLAAGTKMNFVAKSATKWQSDTRAIHAVLKNFDTDDFSVSFDLPFYKLEWHIMNNTTFTENCKGHSVDRPASLHRWFRLTCRSCNVPEGGFRPRPQRLGGFPPNPHFRRFSALIQAFVVGAAAWVLPSGISSIILMCDW